MIAKRNLAVAAATVLSMAATSGAFAQGGSDDAGQHRQSNADQRDRWNWQAGPSHARNESSYQRQRGDARRWRSPSESEWDALGEFDTRSDDRSGRYGAGPRMWRNLDEGSGYTYRERYYDPYADRRSYSNYMRDRYRDDQRTMRDQRAMRDMRDRMRMRDSRDWDRGGYADSRYDRQRYYDDRRAMQSRGERDRYGQRQDRAMGPQGWRGDLEEGLITQPMSSLYEDRGAVGPQGWQPGMSDRSYENGRYGPRGQ